MRVLFHCKRDFASSARLVGSYVRSIFAKLCGGEGRLVAPGGVGICLLISLGGDLVGTLCQRSHCASCGRRAISFALKLAIRRRCIASRLCAGRREGVRRVLGMLAPHRGRVVCCHCVRRLDFSRVYVVVSVGCRSTRGLVRHSLGGVHSLCKPTRMFLLLLSVSIRWRGWGGFASNRCGVRTALSFV